MMEWIIFSIICLTGLSMVIFHFLANSTIRLNRCLLNKIGIGIGLLTVPALLLEIKFLPYLCIFLGWIIITMGDVIIAYKEEEYKRYNAFIGGISITVGIIGGVFNYCFFPDVRLYVGWTIMVVCGIIMFFPFFFKRFNENK